LANLSLGDQTMLSAKLSVVCALDLPARSPHDRSHVNAAVHQEYRAGDVIRSGGGQVERQVSF